MSLAINFDPDTDCRSELLKIGELVFEDTELMPGFLFLDTPMPLDEISQINGIIKVREEYHFKLLHNTTYPDLTDFDIADLIEAMDIHCPPIKYEHFTEALNEGLEDFAEEEDMTIKDCVNALPYEDAKKLYYILKTILEG